MARRDLICARMPPETPPISFARVTRGVYRSGFPTWHNLAFLHRLRLATMIKLEDVDYTPDTLEWIAERGITVTECAIAANQEPFVIADPEEICKALRVLLDQTRHPVLIHSLVGQARVGVVIGCLRKLQRWSLVAIFEEYRRFAGITSSLLDMQCIELFDITAVWRTRPEATLPLDYSSSGGGGASSSGDRKSRGLNSLGAAGSSSTEQLSALAAGSSSTENLPSVDSDAAAARDTITKQQQQQKSRPDALEVT